MPTKPNFDVEHASLAELVSEVLVLRADLQCIAAEFVHEANRREWCIDYDRWAKYINKQLSRPCFIVRTDMFNRDDIANADGDPIHTVEAPPAIRRPII